VLHLPWDWPRINSFPEWYTVDAAREYQMRDLRTRREERRRGDQLASGLPVRAARAVTADRHGRAHDAMTPSTGGTAHR
jgi:hypothetical protein